MSPACAASKHQAEEEDEDPQDLYGFCLGEERNMPGDNQCFFWSILEVLGTHPLLREDDICIDFCRDGVKGVRKNISLILAGRCPEELMREGVEPFGPDADIDLRVGVTPDDDDDAPVETVRSIIRAHHQM